jgi:PPOX class probable F420-dependent enzyme
MSEEMTRAEWRAFLLDGTRTGKLATVRRDGRPHVAPVWFHLDGDELVFTTGEDSVKGRTIRRDPNVAMAVDDETPPFAFVLVEGAARIDPDAVALRYWATRIGGRYMGADRAEEYGARNAVPGELLVRVSLTRVIARRAIAE